MLWLLSIISLLCSSTCFERAAVTLSSNGTDLIAAKHLFKNNPLTFLTEVNGTQVSDVLGDSPNLDAFDCLRTFNLGRWTRGLLVAGDDSITLFSFARDEEAPQVAWKAHLPCTPLKVLRTQRTNFLVCFNETENIVSLYTVYVENDNLSASFAYESSRLTLDRVRYPVREISNVVEISIDRNHYFVIVGVSNTVFYFTPFLLSLDLFLQSLPVQLCPNIRLIQRSRADTVLLQCDDYYFIYSIGLGTWTLRYNLDETSVIYQCPIPSRSLIFNGTSLRPRTRRANFDFDIHLLLNNVTTAKCVGSRGRSYFIYTDGVNGVYGLNLDNFLFHERMYLGEFPKLFPADDSIVYHRCQSSPGHWTVFDLDTWSTTFLGNPLFLSMI